jgi:predicted N-acetyltransferase YhbS
MFIIIRPETPADCPAIAEVNDLAFGQLGEGKLVENLRRNPKFVPELSLVAEASEKVVGYILLFPIKIKSEAGKENETISLALLAVRPEFQK